MHTWDDFQIPVSNSLQVEYKKLQSSCSGLMDKKGYKWAERITHDKVNKRTNEERWDSEMKDPLNLE